MWTELAALLPFVFGTLWSGALPHRRIYPMRSRNFFYYSMWFLAAYVIAANATLVFLDWNSGAWTSPWRFALGMPCAAFGATLTIWAIRTLGIKNTSALRDGFISAGPYLLTRNPQYLGHAMVFIGFAIMANSEAVAITHVCTAFVSLLTPFAEESWLVEQYGQSYEDYRQRVPRYV